MTWYLTPIVMIFRVLRLMIAGLPLLLQVIVRGEGEAAEAAFSAYRNLTVALGYGFLSLSMFYLPLVVLVFILEIISLFLFNHSVLKYLGVIPVRTLLSILELVFVGILAYALTVFLYREIRHSIRQWVNSSGNDRTISIGEAEQTSSKEGVLSRESGGSSYKSKKKTRGKGGQPRGSPSSSPISKLNEQSSKVTEIPIDLTADLHSVKVDEYGQLQDR